MVLGWVGNEGDPVLVVAQAHGAGDYHAPGEISEQLRPGSPPRPTRLAQLTLRWGAVAPDLEYPRPAYDRERIPAVAIDFGEHHLDFGFFD